MNRPQATQAMAEDEYGQGDGRVSDARLSQR